METDSTWWTSSLVVSLACWLQIIPRRTNTYAIVWYSSATPTPTTTVSPSTETDFPKRDEKIESAVSLACWIHPVPLRTNTYVAPTWVPPGPATSDAPTTTVSPST